MLSLMVPLASAMASRLTFRAARMVPPFAGRRGRRLRRAPVGLRLRGRRARRVFGERVVVEENEAFLGASRFDDDVEHGLEEALDVFHRHQLFAELVELAEPGELLLRHLHLGVAQARRRTRRARLAGRVRLLAPRARLRLVEDAEREFDVTECDAVAVHQARATLLLPVDQDVRLPVDLLQIEVAAVEEHLHVCFGHMIARYRDVIPERASHRRHWLVEHERSRGALRGKPLEKGHREASWSGEGTLIDSTSKSKRRVIDDPGLAEA